jgi:hypothetical protein
VTDSDNAERLEVHDHSYVAGPRSGDPATSRFSHAHQRGDQPHQHPDTGPAAYTIDRDEWYAATGLHGGGRRAFVRRPTGTRLERVELQDWQRRLTVVFCDRGITPAHEQAGVTELQLARMRREFQEAAIGPFPEPAAPRPGDGGAAVARMVLGFGMIPTFVYEDRRAEEAARRIEEELRP